MRRIPRVGSILLISVTGLSAAASPLHASRTPTPLRTTTSDAHGTWHPVPIPPVEELGARMGHTMVFDVLHQRFVIFGGWTNEVWTRAIGGAPPWVLEVVAGTPPSPRVFHSAVYDSTAHRMLVFGGSTDGGGTVQNDVWQLDFSTAPPTWSLVATTGMPPAPRLGCSAVFDPARRRMVVFGGHPPGGGPYDASGETWFLDCSTSPPSWQLAGVGGPARHLCSAVFDAEEDRMVLFGGIGPPSSFFSDVWTLSMSTLTWTQVRAQSDPDIPWGAAAAYEPLGHRMFVTNGQLWSLDLDTFDWTQWGYEPGTRDQAAFALDPSGHHGLLHGGSGPFNTLDGTWRLAVDGDPAWSPAAPIANRLNAAGVYDPVRDRFLMIGGQYGWYPLGDISELQIGRDSSWIQVSASTPFGRRSGLGAVYDPVRDRVIVFGGNDGMMLNDTWIVQLSPSLAVLPAVVTGAPPPAREAFAAIYDPVRDRIVIDGGNNGDALGDVWALDLSPTMSWSSITPAAGPAPPARRQHDAIYDPFGDRMIVFVGGLWALSLGGVPAWTPLAPLGTPPYGRAGYTFEFDPNRQRALLFGNISEYDLWELKLGAQPLAWNPLSAGGTEPRRRVAHLGIYDPIHDRMLVSGGVDHENRWQDIWRLQFAQDIPTSTAIVLLSSDARSDRVVLRWGLSGDAATYARLERRDVASGWRTIEEVSVNGSSVTFHDRDVSAGARYAYRLSAVAGAGSSTSEEVWIDVPAGPRFSLAGFSPNPAAREMRVAFSLADRSPATLEVVDVGGRRVASRRIDAPNPGPQVIVMTRAGGFAPGLYFVKLTQGGRTLVRRGSVTR